MLQLRLSFTVDFKVICLYKARRTQNSLMIAVFLKLEYKYLCSTMHFCFIQTSKSELKKSTVALP